MNNNFTFSQFLKQFPDDNSCLEEVIRIKAPRGIFCPVCEKVSKFYKLKQRAAYTCKHCRYQFYPLAGTVFEKSTTPLRLWFYAMFIMTHTKSRISVKKLQRELGVTYKTAWRMYKSINTLMQQNNSDLLNGIIETDETTGLGKEKTKVYRWTLFNTVVISVVHKETSSAESS